MSIQRLGRAARYSCLRINIRAAMLRADHSVAVEASREIVPMHGLGNFDPSDLLDPCLETSRT
jgi:hypothetical protein